MSNISILLALSVLLCAAAVGASGAGAGAGAGVPLEGRISLPAGEDAAHASNVEVTLNGGMRAAVTRADGAFTFHDVSPGIYQLDVQSPRYVYSQFKLKVSDRDLSIQAVEYAYPGAPKAATAYPLSISPHVKIDYFEQKQQINILKMITGNPMMIMMAVSFGAMFLMPKMMEGMDKDQLKEIQVQCLLS
jgi:hypothetical protein